MSNTRSLNSTTTSVSKQQPTDINALDLSEPGLGAMPPHRSAQELKGRKEQILKRAVEEFVLSAGSRCMSASEISREFKLTRAAISLHVIALRHEGYLSDADENGRGLIPTDKTLALYPELISKETFCRLRILVKDQRIGFLYSPPILMNVFMSIVYLNKANANMGGISIIDVANLIGQNQVSKIRDAFYRLRDLGMLNIKFINHHELKVYFSPKQLCFAERFQFDAALLQISKLTIAERRFMNHLYKSDSNLSAKKLSLLLNYSYSGICMLATALLHKGMITLTPAQNRYKLTSLGVKCSASLKPSHIKRFNFSLDFNEIRNWLERNPVAKHLLRLASRESAGLSMDAVMKTNKKFSYISVQRNFQRLSAMGLIEAPGRHPSEAVYKVTKLATYILSDSPTNMLFSPCDFITKRTTLTKTLKTIAFSTMNGHGLLKSDLTERLGKCTQTWIYHARMLRDLNCIKTKTGNKLFATERGIELALTL